MSDEVAKAISDLVGEVRALREEIRCAAPSKRIEADAVYSVDEAVALVPSISAFTLRKKLRGRIIEGKRGGPRAPWMIRGSELLKLGGKAA